MHSVVLERQAYEENIKLPKRGKRRTYVIYPPVRTPGPLASAAALLGFSHRHGLHKKPLTVRDSDLA